MEEYKPECSKSNTVHFGCGICNPLNMKTTPDTTGIEEILNDFRNEIYGENDAIFDRQGNNISTQVENWIITHHRQLQKARQDWLREIEEVMRVDIGDASPTRLALQALLYRYQEELNKH